MRKQIRTFLRTARDHEAWPVVLMLFAVLIPAGCLLWFMSVAMTSERLATRQKFADLYKAHLSGIQKQIESYWKSKQGRLEKLASIAPAPIAFARCTESGEADSLILLDDHGGVTYPNRPSAFPADSASRHPRWIAAAQLEATNNFRDAAGAFEAIARESTNSDFAAKSFQASARCLARAGDAPAALQLITMGFGDSRFDQAIDAQGRLIAANVELFALELATNRTSEPFVLIRERLTRRLHDYGNPMLAASQRRFLLRELQRLCPESPVTALMAEELAASASASSAFALGSTPDSLQRSSIPDVWQLPLAGARALALFRASTLMAGLSAVITSNDVPDGTHIALLPPGQDSQQAFVSQSAGERMPGWHLALTLPADSGLLDIAAGRRRSYLGIGLLVLAGMGVLTFLTVRSLRRQTALARLKNDLAATVSHELKTPLSSMRVLIDTLLASEKLDEQTAREYLQLMSGENERLSRLIHNFLTFSRMQRNKQTFRLVPVHLSVVLEQAIAPLKERFEVPGCLFEIEVGTDLPVVRADADALAMALINLLDNAWKFSRTPRHIILSATGQDDFVVVAVRDNGIGIAPADTRRIFEPFYQIDQRLTRQGSGCGLGLGIVQKIVAAHAGRIAVQSVPGEGSTFTIQLPVPATEPERGTEAVA